MTFPDKLQVAAESGVRTMQFLVDHEKQLQEIRDLLAVKRSTQVTGIKLIPNQKSTDPELQDNSDKKE